jgi:hypothetical protein
MRAPNPIAVGVSTLRRKHANGHRRGGKTTAQAYAEIAARSGAFANRRGKAALKFGARRQNKLLLAREIARGLLRNVVSVHYHWQRTREQPPGVGGREAIVLPPVYDLIRA